MRRIFLAQMGALAAGLAAPQVFAQAGSYPDKPIRVLVPFASGGSVDPIIRIMQPKLVELLGQPLIVDNRPGGTTSIAAGYVVKQPADGYTLFFTAANTHLIHTMAMTLPYEALKDFTLIAAVSRAGWVMAVHESIPAKTIGEYIAYCKANPNKISYASSGVGNANHLAMERFNLAAGIKTVHVPYKSGATAALDLMSGRIQAYFTGIPAVLPGLQSGKVKALAYSAAQKGEVPPNMTFTAAGMPEFETVDSINCVLGPANMPQAIVAKLTDAIQKTLAMPDVNTAFATAGQYAYFLNQEQLTRRMSNDMVTYRHIIKEANIKLEG